MGALGLFGLPFPEEYGGGGADLTTLCVAIEELGRVDQSMAITLEAGVGLGANPIFQFGTEEQRQRWLPDLCAGRALGGFGLTEPDAGSDAGGTRTKAVLDDATDEWVINGEKSFITNSGTSITSLVTVTAVTGTTGGSPDISTIIVPAGTPGFVVQPPYRKMGWHASDTHGLTFVDCRVPAENMLGEPGRGFANFLAILDDGRVAIAALGGGCHRGLSRSLRRVRQRAGGVRSGDRHESGGGVQDRRHGGDGRRGPCSDLSGRRAARRRPSLQTRGGHGASSTPPRPP